MSEPSIRAHSAQAMLATIRSWADPLRSQVLSEIPRPIIERIDAAGRSDWLPYLEYLQVLETVHAGIGNRMFREVLRQVALDAMKSPVMRTFIEACFRVLGLTPAATVRWGKKGWDAVLRHCGEFVGEVLPAPHQARVRLLRIPPELLASHTFAEACAGGLESWFTLCRVRGSIQVVEVSREKKTIELSVNWTP